MSPILIREDDLTDGRVVRLLQEQIIGVAGRRGYEWIDLETGARPELAPARASYLRHGFENRGPFADPVDDPNRVFMTKRLGGRRRTPP